MTISHHVREAMTGASWIRKMFTQGIRLKQQFGGVLVPGSGDPPPPPPPPPLSQDVINAKHDASIAWCIQAIRDLQAKAGA